MAKKIGRILVTNDDGIDAPGLKAAQHIARCLSDDVWVVAPAQQQSGASHSISLGKPLRLFKQGRQRYATNGTPADCVMLAMHSLFTDHKPDLVLSGVNFGQNIAEDVSYSGTVAGAKEGTVFDIRSIALSQALNPNRDWAVDFKVAETYAPDIIRKLYQLEWAKGRFVNINFPSVKGKPDIRITKQGKRNHRLLQLTEYEDPHGEPFFWYDFLRTPQRPGKGTDLEAIIEGAISITPLTMDHSDARMAKHLQAQFSK